MRLCSSTIHNVANHLNSRDGERDGAFLPHLATALEEHCETHDIPAVIDADCGEKEVMGRQGQSRARLKTH